MSAMLTSKERSESSVDEKLFRFLVYGYRLFSFMKIILKVSDKTHIYWSYRVFKQTEMLFQPSKSNC